MSNTQRNQASWRGRSDSRAKSKGAESSNRLPSFISFPLDRFSHATLRSKDDKNTPYQHEASRNGDLYLVFDTLHVNTNEHRRLKVIRGADRLEQLDLNQKVQEALAATNGRPLSSMEPQLMPIVALIAIPKLAIRYITEDQMVRRIQVCFSKNEDFHVALSLLDSVGWPITEASKSKSRIGLLNSRSGHRASSIGTNMSDHSINGHSSSISYPIAAEVEHPNGRPDLQPVRRDSLSSQTEMSEPARLIGYFNRSDVPMLSQPNLEHVQIGSRSNNVTLEKVAGYPALDGVEARGLANRLVYEGGAAPMSGLTPLPKPTYIPSNSSPSGNLETSLPSHVRHSPGSGSANDEIAFPSNRPYSAPGAQMADQGPLLAKPPLQRAESEAIFSASAPQQKTALPELIHPDKDLAAYIAQPAEMRLKVLDEWICAQLDDENFLTLLQDIQNVWRRTGFNYK